MADEYLDGIANLEPIPVPRSEWQASYSGFTIFTNPNLAYGWIELRDENDRIIAHIDNVKAIHLAPHRRT